MVAERPRSPSWLRQNGLALLGGLMLVGAGLIWLASRMPQGKQPTEEPAQVAEPKVVDRLPLKPGAAKGFNVLLITLDTTRGDALGCYGNPTAQTPVIDSLAQRGALFAQAFTPAPLTLPAHTSIMTGLNPNRHGVRTNTGFKLSNKANTLAEVLKASGYKTAAVIASFVLHSKFGLEQGFDYYDDYISDEAVFNMSVQEHDAVLLDAEAVGQLPVRHPVFSVPERRSDEVVPIVLRWLEENGKQKFFIWTHIYDPHAPYEPPASMRDRCPTPYDAEIAYADIQIGHLIEKLREMDLLDHTLVLFMGDHGEGLGEHNEMTHSDLLYDTTQRVPLIFSASALFKQPVVVDSLASLIDVKPTILELLGLPVPPNTVQGTSLLRAPSERPKTVYMEAMAPLYDHGFSPMFGVRSLDAKFVQAPKPELYFPKKDPSELHNQFGAQKTVVEHLRAALQAWEQAPNGPALGGHMRMDADTLRKLESLGYMAATGHADPNEATMDPKDGILLLRQVNNALTLDTRNKPEEAVEIVEKVYAQAPQSGNIARVLCTLYARTKQFDKAIEVRKKLRDRDPGSQREELALGSLYMLAGKKAEAQEAFARALKDAPNAAAGHFELGRTYARFGLHEEAIKELQATLVADPRHEQALSYLGDLYAAKRNDRQAINCYEQLIRISGGHVRAYKNLAYLYETSQEPGVANPDKALAAAQEALERRPKSASVFGLVAQAWYLKGDREKSLEYLRQAVALLPDSWKLLTDLGRLCAETNRVDEAVGYLERAATLEPNNLPALLALAQLRMTAAGGGDAAASLRYAKRAAQLEPNDVGVLEVLVNTLWVNREFDEALRTLDQAIQGAPDPKKQELQQLRRRLTVAHSSGDQHGSPPAGQ